MDVCYQLSQLQIVFWIIFILCLQWKQMLALDILPFGPHLVSGYSCQVPDKFAATLVMEQLTCSGVFEARAMVKD